MTTPDETTAAAVIRQWHGHVPQSVTRFATGAAHYVFDIVDHAGTPFVLRMGLPEQRAAMAAGLQLEQSLVALGVPLPKILASNFEGVPWVAMARLSGTDLGHVIDTLSIDQLDGVAATVAAAQAAAAGVESAGRYGYAAVAAAAPFDRWSAVIAASIERSERRIVAAGLFSLGVIETLRDLFGRYRPALDAQPATPFLHDTTTKNVIVASSGHCSGIVDVDDLCFGDPRYASALTFAALQVHGKPTDYVELWHRHAGWLSDDLFGFYVAVFHADLMAEQGMSFNGNIRPSSVAQRERAMALFDAAVTTPIG